MLWPVRRVLVVTVVLAVVCWHAVGLWQRYAPPSPAEASARLMAGTADKQDRLRCLAVVRAAPAEDPLARLRGAAAALLLEDRADWQERVDAAGPEGVLLRGQGDPWPADEAEARRLAADASFGEHGLRRFLFGQWLRARGDAAAAVELDAARAGAIAAGSTLGAELAAAASAGR